MKLPNKMMEEVVQQVAGNDVIPLVNVLKNRKNVSEFKLAEDIKQEINATRNMLYRLYDANLVSFTRKKDKKKGWYIYYWTFNMNRIAYLFKSLKQKRIVKLKERLERENKSNFFSCENKCMRLDFEQATEFEFKCPECGSLMNQEDNTKNLADIEKEISSLEKEIKT